ncbi:MAG: undecaprenyl-phosphate glucose phosphotransferase [Anaerolineae bacterium]
MRKRLALWFSLLAVSVDAIMVMMAFFAAYQLRLVMRFPPAVNIAPFRAYAGMMLLQVVTLLGSLYINRLYHLSRGASRVDQFYSIVAAVSVGSLIGTAFTSLLWKDLDWPRLMIVYFVLFAIVFLTLGRLLTGAWVTALRAKNPDRVLIVGAGDAGRMIAQRILQAPQLGYQVVGFVDDGQGRQVAAGLPILGPLSSLQQVIRAENVQEVVIALPDAPGAQVLDLIYECERERVLVKVFPDVFQTMAATLTISDLNGLPMLTVRDVALRGWKLSLKRAMDLVGSAVGLVLVSPLLLLIALLIKLDSPGPVFYTQVRMGLDAKPFPMIKFRSMRVGAENETGPVWARRDDPRRTRLGALLRRTSLDELPQLINVLLGEMSLVGPRPERPVFVEQFRQVVPRYMDRHREKAGMTGWAQVNGLRGDTSIVERTKYDLYYVENWSLLLDLKILVRQLFRGASDRNAY